MRIKVIMDSGKEYVADKFNDPSELLLVLKKSYEKGSTLDTTFLQLDNKRSIFINASSISSFEVIAESAFGEDDGEILY